jgi:hypothetical protein
MFYTRCRKCGLSRRWLTKEETKNTELVEENKIRPLTQEEIDSAENVVDVFCSECEPKPKKDKKSKATEEVLA